MTAGKKIRLANEQDSEQLLGIYGPFVRETCVSFEYSVPSGLEFAKRIHSVTEKYPWLVCEADGRIIGYAYASKHRERAAYQWSVDVSVYINPEYHRMHIASALYTALIRILKLQGFYNAFAGIALPNIKSESFHEAFGFKEIGIFHNAGYKFDKWHDVKWFELRICELPITPEPPKLISDIKDTVEFLKIIEDAISDLGSIM